MASSTRDTGTHGPGSLTQNQTGAIYHASYAPSDFVLFELAATPDPAYNVYYAGWDASGTAPPSTLGIHHPEADVKAISFSNSTPETTAYGSDTVDPAGNHWRVNWDSGVTEPGSSGSCLFETNTGRCIGQLHGGPSACGSPIPSSTEHDFYGRLSVSWTGGGTAATRLRDWLDPLNTGTLGLDGDPHITTANGVHYDFQSAGEFVSLRDPDGLEIQTRQAPIATTFGPATDAHDGLATCVSLNTAVATRVGQHRIAYEPNLSGVPDPTGLQLRVDGVLTTLGPTGHAFAGGGSIMKTSAQGGLQIGFPDQSVLYVTPTWWTSQSKWYLNVDVVRPLATDGGSPGNIPIGGIAGAIAPGTWLPALPNGASMGPMPASLHDRYTDLYQKFAGAWRVNEKTSLFDYAPGKSTQSFTYLDWPKETPPCTVPEMKPVRPASEQVAQLACRAITGDTAHNSCIFDVMATGEPGFARTYALSERIRANSTTTAVNANAESIRAKGPTVLTATVAKIAQTGKGAPAGTAQFTVDGRKVGNPIRLDASGRAEWRALSLKPGRYIVSATYIPAAGAAFLPSVSLDKEITVGAGDQ